jgi:hypothetical protein
MRKNSLLLGLGDVSYAHEITAFNGETEDWEARDGRPVPVLKILCKHSINRPKQRAKTFSLRIEIRGRYLSNAKQNFSTPHTCSTTFCKGSQNKFHENPTKGLVTASQSQTDTRMEGRKDTRH